MPLPLALDASHTTLRIDEGKEMLLVVHTGLMKGARFPAELATTRTVPEDEVRSTLMRDDIRPVTLKGRSPSDKHAIKARNNSEERCEVFEAGFEQAPWWIMSWTTAKRSPALEHTVTLAVTDWDPASSHLRAGLLPETETPLLFLVALVPEEPLLAEAAVEEPTQPGSVEVGADAADPF
jgi:hypothetical protein